MTPIFKFEGIYTPVVTPYFPDGSPNWDALAEVIEFLISHGVHGLITGGSTGENYAQSVAERIEVAQFTKEQNKGRLPLVGNDDGVGISGPCRAQSQFLRDQRELRRH